MGEDRNPIDVKIGNALMNLRLRHGFSILRMAVVIGVKPDDLRAIESGRMRVSSELMIRICAYFDVPVTVIPKGKPH